MALAPAQLTMGRAGGVGSAVQISSTAHQVQVIVMVALAPANAATDLFSCCTFEESD